MRLEHLHILGLLIFAILASECKAQDSNLDVTVLHLPKNCVRKSIVGDIVSVIYVVKLTDGTVIEDLRDGEEPFEFRIGSRQAIAGLDIGLRDVCVGEKLRLTVPARLAHGAKGFESLVPGNATLIYELEIKRIRKNLNLFDEIDYNRNGFLSKDEYRRYLVGREREIRDIPDANAILEGTDEEFDPKDTTWMYAEDEEEDVDVGGMLKDIFEASDTNGDGLVSEEEFFRKNQADLSGLDFEPKDPRRKSKKGASKKDNTPPRTAQRTDESPAEEKAPAPAEENNPDSVSFTLNTNAPEKPKSDRKQEL